MIINRGKPYFPKVIEPIKFEDELSGSPSKLTFEVVKVEKLDFQEGNLVTLKVDGRPVFKGYVFTKKRDKEHHIKVTCYDQIRYLKNKDTKVFENMKSSDIFKNIVNHNNLKLGDVDDTGFNIKSYVGDDVSYIDMIYETLDTTMTNTNKKYVMYDDFGKLCLKDIDNMKIENFIISEDNMENFDYESSIDEDVYNQVKLVYRNEDSGKQEVFMAKDSFNINKWGLLQYYEVIDNNDIGKVKADILLELYNRKGRRLSLKGVRGNLDVRAGYRVMTFLNVGDIILQKYLIVESVKFEFTQNHFTMDIEVMGGGFDV